MGILTRLFGIRSFWSSQATSGPRPPWPAAVSASAAASASQRPAPPAPTRSQIDKPGAARPISYDATLVGKLVDDHAHLLDLYVKVKDAVDRKDYRRAEKGLANLKLAFQTHIMVENVKFYVYLQQQLREDEHVSQFLVDIRKDMDGIARTLVGFIRDYGREESIAKSPQVFLQAYEEIGQVLIKRVEMEESRLYTLYASPA